MADTSHSASTPGAASSSSVFRVIVVTPESTALDLSARFVALPLYDGEIGIAPQHSPLIGRLGYGQMRLTVADGQTHSYYVDGGFVQVADNVVSVLTGRAVPAEKIDTQAAAKLVETASTMKADTDELIAIRERQLAQGRAQLQVARRAK